MPFDAGNLGGRDRLGHIEDYLSSNKSDSLNRAGAEVGGRGLITETLDFTVMTPNFAQASHGNCLATLAYLRQGDLITNMTVYDVSAATSNCFIKGCIWDTSGNLLAGTAGNLSTAFSTSASSFVTSALSSQYQPAADQLVYVGVAISGAAGPRLLTGPTPGTNQNQRIGAGAMPAVTASLTTSDALSVAFLPATLGAPWAALS